jgi:leader peptidase (prepilin peptidase) / N-methyltransferase
MNVGLGIGCGLLGLAVGSFLNVVIYRVPEHLSIVRPSSACPNCHAPIAGRDNIPLVSWLALRGRCRSCGVAISCRYPLVEATCAILFVAGAWRFGATWPLPAYLALFAGLLALGAIDLDKLILPKSIVYATAIAVTGFLGVAALQEHRWWPFLVGTLCAVTWWTVFFVINFVSPRVLGFGDVRLALVLGMGLGWLGVGAALVGFFVSNLIGAIVGVTLIALKRARRDQPVPYGIYLAAGTVITVIAWPSIHTILTTRP